MPAPLSHLFSHLIHCFLCWWLDLMGLDVKLKHPTTTSTSSFILLHHLNRLCWNITRMSIRDDSLACRLWSPPFLQHAPSNEYMADGKDLPSWRNPLPSSCVQPTSVHIHPINCPASTHWSSLSPHPSSLLSLELWHSAVQLQSLVHWTDGPPPHTTHPTWPVLPLYLLRDHCPFLAASCSDIFWLLWTLFQGNEWV